MSVEQRFSLEDLGLRALIGALDRVDGAAFTIDLATRAVRLVGPRAAERLGWPADAPIEEASFWRAVPESHRDEVLALLRAVADDRVPRSIEHPMRTGGSVDRWFRTAVEAEDGARPRLIGVMIDVTAARHVEAQWLELESWMVALAETMPLDFWICDREGRCVMQNPVCRSRRGDLVGSKEPAWSRSVAEALEGRRTHEEIEIEREGRALHFVRVVSPIERGGAIRAALGIEIDVTDLKEAERRLTRSLEDLREAQDSLVRKKQLAAIGEMSAVVAHEVRNPLGAIANAIVLLSRSACLGESESELCRIIDEESKRLDRLVTNLLDSVRPMRVELSPVAVSALAERALQQALRADGRANDIRVKRTVDPSLPEIPADGKLVEMALRNVFQNALQAMPTTGEISIDVAREVEREHEWARVTVRDSGCGVSAHILDRIFEPFVTTRATGSGLGLTIVRRVLEAHHGTVSISSEAGHGATCVLRLPARQALG